VPSLKTEVLAASESAVAGCGFRKHRGSLLQARGAGVSGWLGFNLATHSRPQLIRVNPVVGVRFDRLAELRLEQVREATQS
jgi:hypothetical protein